MGIQHSLAIKRGAVVLVCTYRPSFVSVGTGEAWCPSRPCCLQRRLRFVACCRTAEDISSADFGGVSGRFAGKPGILGALALTGGREQLDAQVKPALFDGLQGVAAAGAQKDLDHAVDAVEFQPATPFFRAADPHGELAGIDLFFGMAAFAFQEFAQAEVFQCAAAGGCRVDGVIALFHCNGFFGA